MSGARALVAEVVGTALLLVAIVGSGIEVSRAAPVSLFAHAIVVGAALAVLIAIFGPVSGAHFNPVVTLAFACRREIDGRLAAGYLVAQLLGAVAGTALANRMFAEPTLAIATTARDGAGVVLGEVIATAGLVLVILVLVAAGRTAAVAPAVGAWIAAAIVFTASDAFANPAVTLARMLTDTWAGIRPGSVPGFLAGQVLGGLAAVVAAGWLALPRPPGSPSPPAASAPPAAATHEPTVAKESS
jgi:glycerol uptake facilitator-like aquaporin